MNRLFELIRVIGNRYSKEGGKYLENIEKSSDFQEFQKCLHNLTIEDTELDYNKYKNFFFTPKAQEPGLKFMKLLEEKNYGAGIFFFRPGEGFPIHDHPGMVVSTKILDGTLATNSFNILDPAKQAIIQRIYNEGKQDEGEYQEILKEGLEAQDLGEISIPTMHTHFLTPNLKNVHHVKGIGNCAMMDVFFPNDPTRHFYRATKIDKSPEGQKKYVKLNMEKAGNFNLIELNYNDYKIK